MSENNLLKQRIRNKLKRKFRHSIQPMDFRHLRGFHQRYPPTIPNLLGAGITPDDAFYIGEEWFKGVGSVIGLKPKKNINLQTTNWLEHKTHHTHSGLQKTLKFLNQFDKISVLDTPNKTVKNRVWRLLHGSN